MNYQELCNTPSDINEHLPTLKKLASECDHVTEMGTRAIVSTWALVEGARKAVITIDYKPPEEYGGDLKPITERAKKRGIDFKFVLGDTREMTIDETDLLFIDTNHFYDQLKKELQLHGNKAKKYLVFHDTASCPEIVKAINEFMENGKWRVKEVHQNCNGLMILERQDLVSLKNKLCEWNSRKKQWKYSLIGADGLENVENMLVTAENDKLKGDFVETGVWQGGACIYAKAVIDHLRSRRTVYACDSFDGLPKPNTKKYPVDKGDEHFKHDYLKVSINQVVKNFEECGVDYKDVVFVQGWFEDTMPVLRDTIKDIAILRLDGDMYGSTMDVLDNLYDKVVPHGFIVIDDYCLPRAIQATDDFRKKRNIMSELKRVNHCIHYWRK